MSSMLLAELVATCNALGIYDEKNKKYFVDSFTLDTVKDLIRYLRRDGDDHEIRRHLGQTKVLQTDLIPMLVSHSDKDELFEVTLRLLVNLTNPTLLLYREEMPTERSRQNHYLQMVGHLQSYKEEAFTNVHIWEVFGKKLMVLLEKDWTERDDDSSMCIERLLILIRNILHVPTDTDRNRNPDSEASVHDKVLWALNQSSIMDLLLYLSTENEKQYLMHVLEILSLIMREQNPSSLADAALHRSEEEKLRDEQELLQIRTNESKLKNQKVKQLAANRHSRFGGTYVVKNMKSISDNDMICHKPLSTMMKLDFDLKKDKFIKPKNRRPEEMSSNPERRSAFAIRLFLKEFCIKFLNMAYNPLMNYAKDVLVRSKAQQNDESYYLWAIKFFMEFNRVHDFQVKYVSETISVPTFHYVQQQMEKYREMIKMDQKKFTLWIKRLHLALKAYREFLNTLMEMEKSNDPAIRDATKVLESNIFYVLEYREFILDLIISLDENKMPKVYIRDLVETAHVFTKMLERFCKKNDLVVQKKIRSKTSKKKKTKPSQKSQKSAPPRNKDAEWQEISQQLLAVFRSDAEISTDIIPFDATSDVPIDDQKGDCMKKIQKLMMDYQYEDSIALLRAAREVWPESGVFGTAGMEIDGEYAMMETIYMADIGVDATPGVEDDTQLADVESEDDDDENEDDEESARVAETDFQFKDFADRFARKQVVIACSIVLQDFDKIPRSIWHCALKMLHRIAWDCKFHSMICQASIFRTFQKILENDSPQYKELRKFAVFIMRKFTEIAQRNPHAFMDLLFWKSNKEGFEMDCGYNETYEGDNTKHISLWTADQEDELKILFEENQKNPTNDIDVIDWIVENLIDHTKTRRSVIKKLKELGLIFKAPSRKKSKISRVKEGIPQEFSEHEDSMLKELWGQFGNSEDPMGAIITRMPLRRIRKRFVERLLELGIIQTKSQCRKKNKRKSGANDDNNSLSSGSESEKSDDETIPEWVLPYLKTKPEKVPAAQKSLPTSQIAISLIATVGAGFTEALKWVMESLEEVALDQEAEGFDPSAEGIPLVPISDEALSAMEDEIFKNCLKFLGIIEPSDEQEMYWRISGSMHHTLLRARCEIISKAVEGTLIVPDKDPIPESSKKNDKTETAKKADRYDSSSDDDDDVFARVRSYGVNMDMILKEDYIAPNNDRDKSGKKTPQRRGKIASNNSEDDGDKIVDKSNNDHSRRSVEETILEMKRVRMEKSDSSSDDDQPTEKRTQKRGKILSDDSADDNVDDRVKTVVPNIDHGKVSVAETILEMKRKRLDKSDSSSDDDKSTKKMPPKRVKVVSDDSDDDGPIDQPKSPEPKSTNALRMLDDSDDDVTTPPNNGATAGDLFDSLLNGYSPPLNSAASAKRKKRAIIDDDSD